MPVQQSNNDFRHSILPGTMFACCFMVFAAGCGVTTHQRIAQLPGSEVSIGTSDRLARFQPQRLPTQNGSVKPELRRAPAVIQETLPTERLASLPLDGRIYPPLKVVASNGKPTHKVSVEPAVQQPMAELSTHSPSSSSSTGRLYPPLNELNSLRGPAKTHPVQRFPNLTSDQRITHNQVPPIDSTTNRFDYFQADSDRQSESGIKEIRNTGSTQRSSGTAGNYQGIYDTQSMAAFNRKTASQNAESNSGVLDSKVSRIRIRRRDFEAEIPEIDSKIRESHLRWAQRLVPTDGTPEIQHY